MQLKNKKNNSYAKYKLLNIAVIVMFIYFIFHSIYGSRGVVAYFRLQSEIDQSTKKLSHLRAERLEIENKTKLLRPESLDLDMLEEKVKKVLGVAEPEEKIIKINKENYEN